MRRKQVGIVAALLAIGVVTLTACGQGATQSGSAAPAQEQAQVENAADNAVETDATSGVDLLRGTANSNKADQNTGDRAPENAPVETRQKWVELRAGNAGGLEPAVVNGKGLSVYWFSDDPVNGGVSNCNGDCAKTWPPITVTKGTRLFFPGIRRENINFIKRQDGQFQVTIGGRPAYLFNKDKKAGDILGQNVGGKWFVMNPEGKRAVPKAEAPGQNNGQQGQPAPGAKPASSVTFFQGKNQKDFGDSFAVGVKVEKTCQDLRGGFLSLNPDGAVKIWSEPGCKGKSAVVSDAVNDASAAPVGFPEGVKSYIAA
ncbi:COG4315 family predicted lipoprotein [Lentzea sp. CA-135723]|uniref:COG4315 family predicted lipoprotein n=1 Tax=Lentzea sp. CA-135723 TaxID=3239950 RepID=UPI003D91B150